MEGKTNDTGMLLEVRDVSRREGDALLLDGVRLQVKEKQRLALAGETGSGKTTLLKIMAGLAAPTSGEVFFNGHRVKGPDERLLPGEPGIAYLSQQFEFPNQYRIEEILYFENRLPPEKAEVLFRLCRIDHLMKRKNVQVSGGERQRIALARLLVRAPQLLLLDEPFSNLDADHKHILKSVIHDIGAQMDITCVLVSHDGLDVLPWADEIVVLQKGRIVQQGSPQQLYQGPANAYVARLFGPYTIMSPEQLKLFDYLSDKELLLRPEDFLLVDQSPDAVPVMVQRVHYFGAYGEVEVALADGNLISVRTDRFDITPGSSLYLKLASRIHQG